MSDYGEMMEAVEFASDVNGRVAKALHAALRTIDKLEEEVQFKEAVIRELQMEILMRDAEEAQ